MKTENIKSRFQNLKIVITQDKKTQTGLIEQIRDAPEKANN